MAASDRTAQPHTLALNPLQGPVIQCNKQTDVCASCDYMSHTVRAEQMSAEGCTSALLHINYLVPQSESHWFNQSRSSSPRRTKCSQIMNMLYFRFLLSL